MHYSLLIVGAVSCLFRETSVVCPSPRLAEDSYIQDLGYKADIAVSGVEVRLCEGLVGGAAALVQNSI